MLDFDVFLNNQDYYLEGLLHTVEASLYGLLGAFALGVIIAVMRIAPIRVLNWVGTAYVEFIRNIPLLITVFFFYNGLPVLHISLSGFASGTIGLAVYTSSFIAEAIRAGIQAVPKGQLEAARSSGLTLMYQADLVNSETFDVFSTYIFVGVFYLLLTIPLSLFVRYLERRMNRAY